MKTWVDCKKPLLKVYIAGPDVFREDAIELGEEYKAFLTKNGFEGLYPLDNVCSTSKEIADGNFRLIDECDIILANMNPFRGVEPDSGTSCEIGYAIAMGKQVYCYMDDTRPMTEKLGSRDENGMEIENFGHPLNLMIAEKATIVEGNFYNAVLMLAERVQEKSVDDFIFENNKILNEIETLVKNEFKNTGELNYPMPDGKHLINIILESDDINGTYFYVVQPFREENGRYKPITNSCPTADEDDFKALRNACEVCFNMFATDKSLDNSRGIDRLISRATAISEQSRGLADDLGKFKDGYVLGLAESEFEMG